MSEEPIPVKQWYQFKDWFTRMDELLETLIKISREQTRLLGIISGAVPPTPPTGWEPITDKLDKIAKELDRDYPNFINDIDIDTSDTTWKELKIYGDGFSIVSIGGGFEFKVPNLSAKEITAVAGDSFDFSFTNMYVKGSGAGTGTIMYWRKE